MCASPKQSGPLDWATNFQRDLMAGAVMGGAVHTIVAPIERAKLLLQTQESNQAILGGSHQRFKGMVDCLLRTVREEGVSSLWRGNGSSVLRYYPSVALNFSLKGFIKTMCESPKQSGPLVWATNFQRDLMAGAVMGGAVHTIMAPIERAKLLLQTQESNAAILGGSHRWFKGMVDCLLWTVREEGVSSLWRGNGSSVLRYYPSVALNFSLKDLYRNILRSENSYTNTPLVSGPSANFIAGSLAGCTTLIIIYPLDIAHTRLAADLGKTDKRQFRGIHHFLTTIKKKDGFCGIYRGLPASLHGMVIHRGLYFGGFDTVKEKMSDKSKSEPALWKRWGVAQAVTTSAGLVSYPLDTVRRRMMMQSGAEKPVYRNTLDCWRKIYRAEGVRSFYRGAVSNMFRSTGAAAILVLYDEVKKFMDWQRF